MAATMRAVIMNGVGGPSCLQVSNSVVRPILKDSPYNILLKVSHTALNRADCLQREGKYPVPPGSSQILGLEAVGEVVEVGPGNTKFKVGDKVMALLDGGGYAEYVLARSTDCMVVPPNLSEEQAACIPESWLTAYQLLHFVAEAKPTDNLLIMAGASGVGTAAIQLAKLHGIKNIVTTCSENKKELCKRLGATQTLGKEDPLEKDTFDVVLDPVAGAALPQRLLSCRVDSRYVLYAVMGGIKCELNMAVTLMKRITIKNSTLRSQTPSYKALLCEKFAPLLTSFGTDLQVVHDSTYAIDDVVKAHTRMDESANAGKMVLRI